MARHGLTSQCIGLLALVTLGCQGDVGNDAEDDGSPLASEKRAALDAGVRAIPSHDASTAPDGSGSDAGVTGAAIAEITATGTGCPERNTWHAAIAPDGRTVTVTFADYEVEVAERARAARAGCTVFVTMRSDVPYSYWIEDMVLQGYSYLEPGVTGYAAYGFDTTGRTTVNGLLNERFELTGPVDQWFVFRPPVRTVDAAWSPCGTTRTVRVATSLGLRKTADGPAGWIAVTAFDARVEQLLRFRILARRCP